MAPEARAEIGWVWSKSKIKIKSESEVNRCRWLCGRDSILHEPWPWLLRRLHEELRARIRDWRPVRHAVSARLRNRSNSFRITPFSNRHNLARLRANELH